MLCSLNVLYICYWYGSNLEDPDDRGYDAILRLFLIEMERLNKP
jgi:hypothetical protein